MTTERSGSRLIFVGGAPRSGTTLVQNMLDSHPQILGGPEFLHLSRIADLRKILHASISRGWIDMICSKAELDEHLRTLIQNLFLPLADRNGARFYSEKSPMNILAFSELIELFPESKFIHVVRDPRAIVSSMKRVKQRAVRKGLNIPAFTRSVSDSVAYVKQCFDSGFSASRRFPGKVMTVVFEDLLKAPEAQTRNMCTFLGVTWDEAMLHPGEQKHIGEQAITKKSGEIWYNAKEYYRDPDGQNTDKWKTELTAREQIRTILAFGHRENLKRCGYTFSLQSVTQVAHWYARLYYGYRWSVDRLYRYSAAVAKRIPGTSAIRRGLQSIVDFLG